MVSMNGFHSAVTVQQKHLSLSGLSLIGRVKGPHTLTQTF